MKPCDSAHNNTGGVAVRIEERVEGDRKKRNEAFWEGLLAGLVVIGAIAFVLLLIFWL